MNEELLKEFDKMKIFLGKMNGEYVFKKDFDEYFQIFKEAFKEMKRLIDRNVNDVKNTSSKQDNTIKELEKNINEISLHLDSQFSSQLENVLENIKRIEKIIPPSTDLTPIETKIDNAVKELELKIPELREETPEDIRNKLEALQGDERLDKSAIKGLEDSLKRIEDKISSSSGPRSGGFGIPSGTMQIKDLSSQTNGTLKVFTVPKNTLGYVIGSDFPSAMFEGNGFTINASRTQITLTTTNAPSTNSQLAFIYSSVFNVL